MYIIELGNILKCATKSHGNEVHDWQLCELYKVNVENGTLTHVESTNCDSLHSQGYNTCKGNQMIAQIAPGHKSGHMNMLSNMPDAVTVT